MPASPPRPISGRSLLLLCGAFALSVLSCGREPTGPGGAYGGAIRYSQVIAFNAEFPAGYAAYQQANQATGSGGVAFTTVRVVLRNADGTVALDTTVTFPPGADSLPVYLNVPLPASAPAGGVPLALTLDYKDASGATVFTGGPVNVNAVPATPGGGPPPPAPVQITLTYTGPGSTAAGVRITPKATTVNTGGAFSFSAVAVDAGGDVVPNTPIVFVSEDGVLASVNALTGVGSAGPNRGSTRIVAQLLTHQEDAATLTIVAPPASIAAASGSGQSANVNAQLANPVVVQVNATDGQPASGVTVTFAAQNGGSVGSASVVTGANGQAQTTWRLGGTAGAQTLTASATGLAGSPVTFAAIANPLQPVRLVFLQQPPVSGSAGAPFIPAVTVQAVDATGAVTTAFTGSVTIALGAAAPAGAVLSGTTTANAVDGVATFADLSLNLPGAYTLVASTSALTGATSNSFVILAGPANRLAFQNYPVIGAQAGAVLDPITVVVRDGSGNMVAAFAGAVTLTANGPTAVASNEGNAALSPNPRRFGGTAGSAVAAVLGTMTVNAVAGVATFSDIRLTGAGAYTLSAAAEGLLGTTGPSFVITPGPASNLVTVSGDNQTAAGGAPLPAPIVVAATDAYGNGISGITVNFVPAGGSGTVNPVSAVTVAGGTAQTSWTILGTAGLKTLNVTAAGLSPNPLVVTATATSSSGALRTWTGATNNDWATASNWSPAGVPGGADIITIPVSPNSPTISSPVTIGELTLASGVLLTNTSTLTINGSLDAGGGVGAAVRTAARTAPHTARQIDGNGAIIMAGTGTVRGTINANVTFSGGAYVLSGQTNINGSVSIGAGSLGVGPEPLWVSGDFATATGGKLVMTDGSGSVFVGGNATFNGGSTAGAITAGALYVLGNFTTTGAAYAASGTHTLHLNGPAATTQTLSFSSPIAGNGINHLVLEEPSNKVMVGTPEIIGDVSLTGNTMPVTGAATVRIGGNFADATIFPDTFSNPDPAGGWRVANTHFFGTNKTINSGFISSNVLISGSLSFVTALPVAAIRSPGAGNVARVLNPYYVQINGSLSVSGGSALLTIGGQEVYVGGGFATTSGGRLSMTDPYAFLGVAMDAMFAGGSTAGLLTAGEIFVIGDFTQGGGAADAFAPAATFETYVGMAAVGQIRSDQRASTRLQSPRDARALAGDRAAVTGAARAAAEARHSAQQMRLENARGDRAARMSRFEARQSRLASAKTRRGAFVSRGMPQLANFVMGTSTISFANPTSSFFGELYLAGLETILLSDVTVAGMLESGISFNHFVRSASPRTITSHGADVRDLQFDNVRWVLLDGFDVWAMDYVSFMNMDPTVDQFTITRTADERAVCECSYYYLYWWSFFTQPTSGKYIRASDTNGSAVQTLELYMEDPLPTTHEGYIATAGGALISNWPQTFVWTGLGATDNWTEGANWSTGYQPGPSDDVTIPAGTPRNPIMNLDGYVHNLTIGTGKTIDTNCRNLYVHGNLVAPLSAPASIDCDGDFIKLIGDGAPGGNTVVGNFAAVFVDGNYKVAGTGNQLIVNYMEVGPAGGNLTVNGGRVDAGSFLTQSDGFGGGATLTMTNPADQVFVTSGANFWGGSTTGKLTAGTLTLASACLYTSGAPDAFAPSGTHKVVISGVNSCVSFADPVNSFFQGVDLLAGTTMLLNSPVTVNGTFTRGAGATPANITGTGGATAYLVTTSALAGFLSGSPTAVSNVKILLGTGATAVFNDVAFSGYDIGFSGSIFAVNRSGGPFTFTGLNFGSTGFTASASAHFVHNVGPANITISGATPASGVLGTTHITTGGTVSWP